MWACMFMVVAILCAAQCALGDDGRRQKQQLHNQSCPEKFKAFGITERFPGVVAHGLHDITVEDLKVFKADIGCVDNGIPTVNRNLLSAEPILSNAPCLDDKSPFVTPSMRIVDHVLQHMDNNKYDVGAYSGLERLVHAFHMREMWSKAVSHYNDLHANPPGDDVCACALDIDNNGVMKMLRFVALQIREPGLMYGQMTEVNGHKMGWDGNLYNYAFFVDEQAVDKFLAQKEKPIPRLLAQADWTEWKKLMGKMIPSDDRELAIFIYCALKP